jgi:hypothetical protein
MIELGRHNKMDINNRICPLCKNGVEDEYHFIILCSTPASTILGIKCLPIFFNQNRTYNSH